MGKGPVGLLFGRFQEFMAKTGEFTLEDTLMLKEAGEEEK